MIRSGFQTSANPYGSDQFKGGFGGSYMQNVSSNSSGSSGLMGIASGVGAPKLMGATTSTSSGSFGGAMPYRINSSPSYASTFSRGPMNSASSIDRGPGTSYNNFKVPTAGAATRPYQLDRSMGTFNSQTTPGRAPSASGIDRASGTSYTNYKPSTPGPMKSPSMLDRSTTPRINTPVQTTAGALKSPMSIDRSTSQLPSKDTYSDAFSRRVAPVNGTGLMKDRLWGGKFMPGGQGTWGNQASYQSAQRAVGRAFAKPSGAADSMARTLTPKIMPTATTPMTTRTGTADTMARTATKKAPTNVR